MIDGAIVPASLFCPEDFAQTQRIAAAVSGGGDSLALLFLLHDYLEQRGEAHRLVAVTVDHGLRAESAQEAAMVAQVCARWNIRHRTMRWQGEKPQSAVSHRARLARYDLLCQAAAAENARVIVTGHTLDDQAETYAMRLQRGAGRGLAAMPRLALLQREYCLLRPLLGVRRRRLRHYLRARDLPWIDDPTNDNPGYERVRVRRSLDDQAVAAAQRAVLQAALHRRQEAAACAALAVRLRMRLEGERLWFDLHSLTADGQATALAGLLAISAAIMGGSLYLPPERRKLQDILEKRGPLPQRMTLSGAVVEVTEKFARVWREKRNLNSVTVCPGAVKVWDGRYRIHNRGDEALVLRPPAPAELRQAIAALPDDRAGETVDLHRPSLATGCAISGGNTFAIPVLGYYTGAMDVTIERIMQPFDWLVSGDDRPLFDVFRAVFAAGNKENGKNWQEWQSFRETHLGNDHR